ncbi:polysaccharide deacetylase family protein [Caldibacillus debilis]|uniref:Putative xylanase/chitin deacetylase n=1 Tax=Caldibacillus debilis GB1 TaxID=1339248 RepID=A0A420VDM0_9BACI|nr:polysaccharide deacetylase family protein [Caldibacillus debilis]RKO61751.1 putative xylanase/chitin deacetylase [Caldibacillus debilis GB1]
MVKRLLSRKIPFVLGIFIFSSLISGFGWFGLQKANATTFEKYQTTANLNMRTGPSTRYRIITTIPKGKVVTYVSKSGSWYKVKYGSKTGYSSSKYLKKVTASKTSASKGYKVPILMYHCVDNYKGSGLKELYVTPKNFEAQMKYLKSAGFTPITFEDLPHINRIKKPVLITFDDGYKNNMNAYNILKSLKSPSFKPKATIFIIGKKIDTKNGLSKKELKLISDSGIISVQSHTESHNDLRYVKNYKKELGDIKKELEKITGKKVIALAYPSGRYNSKVIAEAKKYYQYAVTTKPGIANTASSHFEMKRLRVSYSTSLSEFKKMLNQK